MQSTDALSRLPLEKDRNETHEDLGGYAFIRHLEHLPVIAMTLVQETRHDPTLSLVLQYTREGWPTDVPKYMEPYVSRRHELSVEQDCVGCESLGSRVTSKCNVTGTACRTLGHCQNEIPSSKLYLVAWNRSGN